MAAVVAPLERAGLADRPGVSDVDDDPRRLISAAACRRMCSSDCELVAFDASGRPDFHLLYQRMLRRRSGITVGYMAFDLLARDGEPLPGEPYRERRRQLEDIDFDGRHVPIVPTFEGGETPARRVSTLL